MAKIPSPKPFGISHDAWTREGSKCKNSQKYLDNYDYIFRKNGRKDGGDHGHVKYVTVNGKHYVLPNPATHGESAQKAWEEFEKETGGFKQHKLKAIHE